MAAIWPPTRAALRALEQGRILGVFPEGRIETTRDLLPFQTGVALMAIKANVPVFPACLDGTRHNKEIAEALLKPNRARVSFGPEVVFDRNETTHAALEAATLKLQDSVKILAEGMKARI